MKVATCFMAVLLVAGAAATQVFAQEGIPSLRGKPTKEEIARALSPPAPEPVMRSRGIVLNPGAGTAAAKAASTRRAIDLEVLFEFDSARLTPDGRDVLDSLGGALGSSELADVRRVTLEGHTDAKGSDAYNDSLSLLRAQSARQYLIQKHRITPDKLHAVGKGKAEPADPRDPYGAANRRVRVVVEGQS
ncbi:MAG TPA: OmpA family protein [Usitatibacteraceae bacterium]|nr:OmpA family protein [Usitatibacteraceae bacterium]